MKRRLFAVMACVLGCCLFASQGMAATTVDVYAEGAYTDTDLAVYIYADINTTDPSDPALISFGVKLTYLDTELTVTSAEKNEAVWYMGDGVTNEPYMDPEIATVGEVVIIGGKLDTAAPLAGVSGTRVLLGKVFFDRVGSTMPFDPTLGLTYGRMTTDTTPVLGSYKNFVATDGTVMDGTSTAIGTDSTYERGDANADGSINVLDLRTLREVIGTDAPCWTDCNGDGTINVLDIRCLRESI